MFNLSRSKKIVNIVIDDYVIRLIETIGEGLSNLRLIEERVLPKGLVERGKIKDELEFYDFMKTIVKELKIRNRHVRFYVPNSLVIMRQVDIPANLQGREIKDHIMLEIGGSLHLPFDKPIFDVHMIPSEENEGNSSGHRREKLQKGILFAVPEVEVKKYTEIFLDVSLKPIVADVQALGMYRYFQYISENYDEKDVYLFYELNLTSTNISIYHRNQIEFLRYQYLDIHVDDWEAKQLQNKTLAWIYTGDESHLTGTINDQIRELDRIMNFYRYSLHQGEKVVTQIIVCGDSPQLDHVMEQIKANYNIPVKQLIGYLSQEKTETTGAQFVPALGLALKGVGR